LTTLPIYHSLLKEDLYGLKDPFGSRMGLRSSF
jgi:hypothetical protein